MTPDFLAVEVEARYQAYLKEKKRLAKLKREGPPVKKKKKKREQTLEEFISKEQKEENKKQGLIRKSRKHAIQRFKERYYTRLTVEDIKALETKVLEVIDNPVRVINGNGLYLVDAPYCGLVPVMFSTRLQCICTVYLQEWVGEDNVI